MRCRRALCLLPLAISVPGWAEPDSGAVAIGFAPPLEQTYLYHVEQHRAVEGRESRFVTRRQLRFERVGNGYRLLATLRQVDTDAPPAGADPFRAALLPLVGVELRFLLDPEGRLTALENDATVTAAWMRTLRQQQAGARQGNPTYRAVSNVLTLLSGLSAPGRLALLSGDVQPLFLFANNFALGGKGRGLKSAAGSPLAHPKPVEGRVILNAREGEGLFLTEALTGEGITVRADYQVDRRLGLVMSQSRTLSVQGRVATDNRTFEAVE